MKIFFSWQSHTEPSVNRHFIGRALKEAVDEINQMTLEEAARGESTVSIDSDTAGVVGAPAIADTILRKIDECTIFVGDLTLTGSTESGEKHHVNSNVMYELGYAHKAISPDRFLNVMNTYYGDGESLPFDLRHRRWPFRYNLPPSSSKGEIRREKERLKEFLKSHIPDYVDDTSATSPEGIEAKSTTNRALYWDDPVDLVGQANAALSPSKVYGSDRPLAYVRVWPSNSLAKLTSPEVNDPVRFQLNPLLGGARTHLANQFGRLFYTTQTVGDELRATAQLFTSREIWGLCSWILEGNDLAQPYLPSHAFANGMYDAVREYLQTARDSLGYKSSAFVEIGLVNVRGVLVPSDACRIENGVFHSDPFYRAEVSLLDLDNISSDVSDFARFHVDAMNEIFGAAGLIYQRPPEA